MSTKFLFLFSIYHCHFPGFGIPFASSFIPPVCLVLWNDVFCLYGRILVTFAYTTHTLDMQLIQKVDDDLKRPFSPRGRYI